MQWKEKAQFVAHIALISIQPIKKSVKAMEKVHTFGQIVIFFIMLGQKQCRNT